MIDSIEKIMERVKELDTTLVWSGNAEKSQLVSSLSGRVIAEVNYVNSYYKVFQWRYSKAQEGYCFVTLESAKHFAKFDAIREKLDEDLRSYNIQ